MSASLVGSPTRVGATLFYSAVIDPTQEFPNRRSIEVLYSCTAVPFLSLGDHTLARHELQAGKTTSASKHATELNEVDATSVISQPAEEAEVGRPTWRSRPELHSYGALGGLRRIVELFLFTRRISCRARHRRRKYPNT